MYQKLPPLITTCFNCKRPFIKWNRQGPKSPANTYSCSAICKEEGDGKRSRMKKNNGVDPWEEVELQRKMNYRGKRTVCWLEKTCTKCGKVFPIEKFQKDEGKSAKYDSRAAQCGNCRYTYTRRTKESLERRRARQRTPEHREKVRKRRKERGREDRTKEYANVRLKRARSNGFNTVEEWEAHRQAKLDSNLKFTNIFSEEAAKLCWRHWIKNLAPVEWIKAYNAAAERHRYKANPAYAAYQRMRRQIRKHNLHDLVQFRLRKIIKGEQNEIPEKWDLGYTAEEFVDDMAGKFTDGMTMQDFIDAKIHIDHIIPVSKFNLNDPEQFKRCWSLDNLQPLWASDNLAKRDKFPWDDNYPEHLL